MPPEDDMMRARPRSVLPPTLSPAEWRAHSRMLREVAEEEDTEEIRRRLADHALNLAFLAEKIERNQLMPGEQGRYYGF